MSGRSTPARQEAQQYERTSQPDTRPWDCEVLADLFGLSILLEGRRFHIPYDRVDQVITLLTECKRLDPASRAGAVEDLQIGKSEEGWMGD